MREIYKLTQILRKYFNINFARITLIAQMIVSLIKVRSVCLSEMATGFAGKARAASSEKRIHRFLKDFLLILIWLRFLYHQNSLRVNGF